MVSEETKSLGNKAFSVLGAESAKSLPLESCVREDEVFQQQSLLVAELA